ncbi:hypothetical protein OIU85_012099 [Salix viminalis]|uniref:Uncharacterized protein n=1 Tax=Salix viminalis TaxID=40686 RepID=A0A9Q0NU82_SALVM|nr:hypothetical protein OIU85_012099 [Salix viminalis]
MGYSIYGRTSVFCHQVEATEKRPPLLIWLPHPGLGKQNGWLTSSRLRGFKEIRVYVQNLSGLDSNPLGLANPSLEISLECSTVILLQSSLNPIHLFWVN